MDDKQVFYDSEKNMAPLPGKNEMLMRTASMLMLLVSFIIALVFVGTGLDSNLISAALITGPIVMAVLLIFVLKAEYDFLDEKRNIFIAATLIIGLILDIAIGYGIHGNSFNIIIDNQLLTTASIFALINCWHYTLTIYKNQMNMHLGLFVVFMILYFVGAYDLIGLLTLVPTLIATVAVALNQYAVNTLKKNKLLKLI